MALERIGIFYRRKPTGVHLLVFKNRLAKQGANLIARLRKKEKAPPVLADEAP